MEVLSELEDVYELAILEIELKMMYGTAVP